MDEPRFKPDLYHGAAVYYDTYRLPYPRVMLDDLLTHVRTGAGTQVFDLACGTGQVMLAIADRFDGACAIDSEREMVALAEANAALRGLHHVDWRTYDVEEFLTVPDWLDLVTIGNAFHRLNRRRVAAKVYTWLRPGGCIALLWSDTPWAGDAPWQHTLRSVNERWIVRLGASDRLPPGLEAEMTATPNSQVLAHVGFEVVGPFEFVQPHVWTVASLYGFMLSTSILSMAVLGDQAAGFESELRDALLAVDPSGEYRQQVSFMYELGRKPN